MAFISSFQEAWKNRAKLGDDKRTRSLAAFLPAALEIQESPPNPLAKWVARALIALFVIALVWACIGRLDVVASAEGKIIPSARVKTLQPLEKAAITQILVEEGQRVEAGQPLIELDATATTADSNRLLNQTKNVQWKLSVAEAYLTLLDNPEPFPTSYRDLRLNAPQLANDDELKLHQQMLWQQWQEYRAQELTLESELDKNRAEHAFANEVVTKLEKTLPIVAQRARRLESLHKQNFASENEFLELEQRRIEVQQDLAAEMYRLQQLDAANKEIRQRLKNHIAQTKSQQLRNINEYQTELASLQQELYKANDRNAKKVLYAPVAGQIQNLAVTTIGGIVTEAQDLLTIVPSDGMLEVEVFLQNQDIGFVQEGMPAEIKIHTFPFTKYGVIEGRVSNVSDDAIHDEKRGLIYSMNVEMAKNSLHVNGKPIQLIPGMAVTAEVKTDRRRIIDYFIRPIAKNLQESVRER